MERILLMTTVLGLSGFLNSAQRPLGLEESITQLSLGVDEGDAPIAYVLDFSDIDINAQNPYDGSTLLMEAVTENDIRSADELLERGADLSLKDIRGNNALIKAAERGNIPLVEHLLASGALPNECNREGDTALHRAVAQHRILVIQKLLESGADIFFKNSSGRTPFMSLVASMDRSNEQEIIAIIRLFLRHGVLVNDDRDSCGRAALHWACMTNRYEVALFLIDNGADSNAQDRSGDTPLHYLAELERNPTMRRPEALRYRDELVFAMLQRGANPLLINKAGDIPLTAAAKITTDCYLIQMLLDAGSPIDYQNGLGKTALMQAVEAGMSADVVALLIARGASRNMTDTLGETALTKLARVRSSQQKREIFQALLAP